jgi:hypothetical protein
VARHHPFASAHFMLPRHCLKVGPRWQPDWPATPDIAIIGNVIALLASFFPLSNLSLPIQSFTGSAGFFSPGN